MPIEYRINHERRLVLAKGSGTLAHDDVFSYQREVWSKPEVAAYDELMDMSGVEEIVVPSRDQVRQLAALSAGMDLLACPTKFAIVAPSELAFGLGRMYETYRSLESRSTKQVGVFRSMGEALVFLSIEGDPFDAAAAESSPPSDS